MTCQCNEYETCPVCLSRPEMPPRDPVTMPDPKANPPTRPGNVGQYDAGSTYEPIRVIEAYDLNFNLGNVVKYILRAGRKPGATDLDDLRKAEQYIRFEIERRERKA